MPRVGGGRECDGWRRGPPSSRPEGAIPPQTGSLGPRWAEPSPAEPVLICSCFTESGVCSSLLMGLLEPQDEAIRVRMWAWPSGPWRRGTAVQHPLLSRGTHPHFGCPGPVGPRLVAPALVEVPRQAAAWSNDTHSLRAGVAPRERPSHDGSSITAPMRSPSSG